jgi:hypothetical protein
LRKKPLRLASPLLPPTSRGPGEDSGNTPWLWLVLALLVGLRVYPLGKSIGLFRAMLPDDTACSIVIFILAFLPTAAYGMGKLRAAAVLKRTDYQYVVSNTVEDLPIGNTGEEKNRIKYLGLVNGYVFLLLPDNMLSWYYSLEMQPNAHVAVWSIRNSAPTSSATMISATRPGARMAMAVRSGRIFGA